MLWSASDGELPWRQNKKSGHGRGSPHTAYTLEYKQDTCGIRIDTVSEATDRTDGIIYITDTYTIRTRYTQIRMG